MSFTKKAIPDENITKNIQTAEKESYLQRNTVRNGNNLLKTQKNLNTDQSLKIKQDGEINRNEDQLGDLMIRIRDPRSKEKMLTLQLSKNCKMNGKREYINAESKLSEIGDSTEQKNKLVGSIQINILQKNGVDIFELDLKLLDEIKIERKEKNKSLNQLCGLSNENWKCLLEIPSKNSHKLENDAKILKKRNCSEAELESNENFSEKMRIKTSIGKSPILI